MSGGRKIKQFATIEDCPPEQIILNKRTKNLKGKFFNNIEVLYYVGSDGIRAYFLCKCPYCKKYFTVCSNNLQNGHTKSCGCLISIRLRKNIEGKIFNKLQVLKYDKSMNENPYWIVKCLECGKIYSVSGEALRAGQYSCGCLNMSTKAKIIQEDLKSWCEKTGRYFATEKTFKDCVFKSKLKFDFYLGEYEGCKPVLIEYDGEQHFSPIKFNNKISDTKKYANFVTIQITDWCKDLYCIENGFNLLRINYTTIRSPTYEQIMGNCYIVGKKHSSDDIIETFDINEADLINYQYPTFNIASGVSCSFKCGKDLCQNSGIAKQKKISCSIRNIIEKYEKQSLSKSITFQGLEPLDNLKQLLWFIYYFRKTHQDNIIIWTGYTKEECDNLIYLIKNKMGWKNIIIKFGRYIPVQKPHRDNVLGVDLASDNQYAEVIS